MSQYNPIDVQQTELLQHLLASNSVSEVSRKTGFLDDHLPLPAHRTHESVEVPYLCAEKPYDNGSILTYHYRRGWTDADVHDPKQTRKSDEIGEFFQNWFFFGLLRDILGFPINPRDFVQENGDGALVMTTKRLPDHIKRWYSQERKFPPNEQKLHAERGKKALSCLCNVMHDWVQHKTSPLDDWTSIYLVMLGQYLSSLLLIVFRDIVDVEVNGDRNSLQHAQMSRNWDLWNRSDPSLVKICSPWYGSDLVWPSFGDSSLHNRMIADGWCPSDVQRLHFSLMTYGLYAASMCKPPGSQKLLEDTVDEELILQKSSGSVPSFRADFLRRQHQQCFQYKCKQNQIDERNYETKHISAGCTCNHLEVNTSRIVEILSSGQIPLVQIGRGVHIVPAEPESQYVAISHVWSDGLGNPKANSLPACQLIRLAVQCKALYFSSANPKCWWDSPTLLWIDTICCPVENKKARSQAISLMARTYKEAHRVLVIESSLLSRSLVLTGPMELLMAIFCSKWQRRLWCLSERLLGKDRIRFQFKDGAISVGAATLRVYPEIELCLLQGHYDASLESHDIDDLTKSECVQFHAIYQSTLIEKTCGVDRKLGLWPRSVAFLSMLQTLLPFRSTSKPADEALCLSSLVGVDPKHILDASNDQDSRMEIFWAMVEKIPPEVLFWVAPRLQTKGFRWAPKTFMDARAMSIGRYNEFGATLTEDGLRVHFPGWMLGCSPGRPIKGEFVMVDMDKTVYTVSCRDCDIEYLTADDSFNPWLQAGWIEGTDSPDTLYLLSRFDPNGEELKYEAFLVLAYRKGCFSNREPLHARYIRHALVHKHETGVSWTRCYIDWIETQQSRGDIDPETVRLEHWDFDYEGDEIIDLTGCFALPKDHPWIID